MSGPVPDYYAILDISETEDELVIRNAYKRAALKTHPDRVSADSPERAERTRRFQLVNDAYYVLSDKARRREYKAQRASWRGSSGHKSGGFSDTNSNPFAEEYTSPPSDHGGSNPGAFFSWAWNFFNNQNSKKAQPDDNARQRTANDQFGDVFEDMMSEELGREEANASKGWLWSAVGTASGGAMGMLIANLPGLVAGAAAGNRLGAIRDRSGKSVYAVFQELPQDARMNLLTKLAARVFASAVGA